MEYVRIWRYLAEGYRQATDRELLFFIDEWEVFQASVDQTRAADTGVAMRELFDAGNRSVGVVTGLTAPSGRGGDFTYHPLGRPDVASRVQNLMLRIQGLGDEDRRRRFLEALVSRLVRWPKGFLTPSALDTLTGPQGMAWATKRLLVHREPVQREFVHLLDDVAQAALRRNLTLPLDGVSAPHEGNAA